MKNIIKYSLAVAALLVLNASPASAAGSVKTTSDVFENKPDGALVGTSTLVRTSQGISMTIKTTGLPAGHAVTVWFCIVRFDAAGEFLSFDCVHAAGHVVGSDGNLNAAGAVKVGDVSTSITPWDGADGFGLLDPLHEWVTLVVRDHGPAVPGLIPEQIHTFQPGCPTCAVPDPQYSDHPDPAP